MRHDKLNSAQAEHEDGGVCGYGKPVRISLMDKALLCLNFKA